ncbi:MAG: glycine-rich protein [Lachnospiraceae bacterium]|nr:glycine-rich protein [Lachnospiraceae bacterium]
MKHRKRKARFLSLLLVMSMLLTTVDISALTAAAGENASEAMKEMAPAAEEAEPINEPPAAQLAEPAAAEEPPVQETPAAQPAEPAAAEEPPVQETPAAQPAAPDPAASDTQTEAAAEQPAGTETPSASEGTTAATETQTEAAAEQPAGTELPGTNEEQPEEHTEGQTAEPGETALFISELAASAAEIKPGETVVWTFSYEGAESVIYEISGSDEMIVASGDASSGEVRFTPERSGVYTASVKAYLGERQTERTASVTVRADELNAAVTTTARYAFANEDTIVFDMNITGGAEPYTAAYTVKVEGNTVYTSETTDSQISYMPAEFGVHTLEVTVTDADGAAATAVCEVPVAVRETESREYWESTIPAFADGMTFAGKLIAVAKSQLGYQESQRNFIIEEDGEKKGYTRYGDWAGMPYEDWCAMFVSFCLHYAQIPESAVPQSADCRSMKEALGGRYIDDEDAYTPEQGDLIFFHHDEEDSKDANDPNHIGIVTGTEGDTVYTIEGNSDKAVRERSYARSDASIVGYASMRKAMEDYDPNYHTEVRTAILSDENTGVSVTISEDALPEGVLLENVQIAVTPLSEEENESYRLQLTPEGDASRLIAYDITLIDGASGEAFEPVASVNVQLPLPEDYEGSLTIYHIEDENVEVISAADTAAEVADFAADSFSIYAMLLSSQDDDESFQNMKFSAQLFSGAVRQENGDYVWNATNTADEHRFSYRINYDFDIRGEDQIEPGMIKIKVPLTLFKDRSGVKADKYEMSIPSREEAEKGKDDPNAIDAQVQFAYYEEGDSIVIYNFREIDSTSDQGYIEMAYSTTKKPYYYKDYETAALEGGAASFAAVLEMSGIEKKSTDPIPTYINTKVSMTSVEKRYPKMYKKWNEDWGAAPDDAGEYWYLLWTVETVIDKGSTQAYSITLNDQPVEKRDDDTDETAAASDLDQQVVGIVFSGGKKITWNPGLTKLEEEFTEQDKSWNTVSGQILSGNRYDSVITRVSIEDSEEFLASKIPEDTPEDEKAELELQWTVYNKVDVTVSPADYREGQEGTEKPSGAASTRDYTYKQPWFQDPSGQFDAFKRADGAYRTYAPVHKTIFEDTSGWSVVNSLNIRTDEYTRYDLEAFQNDKLNTYGGFDYALWLSGQPNILTKGEKPADSDDSDSTDEDDLEEEKEYEKYGRTNVRYELVDEDVRIILDNGKELVLGEGDFEFSSIQFNEEVSGFQFNEETQSFRPGSVTDHSGDVITFYGKFSENGEWEYLGKANPFTGETENRKGSFNGRTLNLEGQGCIGYKVVTENAYYNTNLGTVPSVTLKDSNKVKNFIQEQSEITVHNTAAGNLYRKAEDDTQGDTDGYVLLWSIPAQDSDYARTAHRDSSLRKEITSGVNNTKQREFTIYWRVSQTETVQDGSESGDYSIKRQQSGVFYDLLPKSASLDAKSVAVTASGEFLPSNAYRVSQESNYRGSGRTLLTVTVDEPGDNYVLYYQTKHGWDTINDLGRSVLNPVAYQTGNEDIANGYPDNGGDLPESERELMSGLDPASTGDRFIYASALYDISAIVSGASGLTKRTKALEDPGYSSNTSVNSGGAYSYQLRYAVLNAMTLKDMVFFDALENDTAEGQASEWHGTLTAVDVSQLEMLGIAPVVYYSTDVNAVPQTPTSGKDEIQALLNGGSWIKADEYTGELSEVKAIAVDMSRTKDGGEFVLTGGTNSGVSVIVHMQAPKSLPENAEPRNTYAETYNGVSLFGTQVSEYEEEEKEEKEVPLYYFNGHTTVRYTVKADVYLKKVSQQNSSQAIPNITFRLWGTSDYGNETDMFSTTNSSGVLIFEGVEKGKYALQEYETTSDWLLDTTPHEVVIGADGSITVDDESAGAQESPIVVTNEPRIHGNLVFYKMSEAAGNYESEPVSGVRFLLTTGEGKTDYGNFVEMYAVSDAKGRVEFNDVEKGTYTLKELDPDENYLKLPVEPKVVIGDNGKASITIPEPADKENLKDSDIARWVSDENNVYTVWNEHRYWEVSFRKADEEEPTIWLQGASFRLTGTSDLGNAYDQTVESDAQGLVKFDHIEKGTYTLRELKAPQNVNDQGQTGEGGGFNRSYILDETPHVVHIGGDGTVTIDGLKKYVEVLEAAKEKNDDSSDDDDTANSGGTTEGSDPSDDNDTAKAGGPEEDDGGYCWTNARALEGKIVITKKWDDTKNDAERPTPVIHLATDKDEAVGRGYTVTYKANGGSFTLNDTQYASNVVRYAVAKESDGTELSVKEGQYIEPTVPSDPNVVFNHWYWEKDGQSVTFNPEEDPKNLDHNVTVYAAWTAKWNYDYTGSRAVFTAPFDGYYKLEAWGAQGGGAGNDNLTPKPTNGSKGGYSGGIVQLKKGEVLYVYVGGAGESAKCINWNNKIPDAKGGWNGGGHGTHDRNDNEAGGGGGGATDFRRIDASSESAWCDVPEGSTDYASYASDESLLSRILVAGGGGGAGFTNPNSEDGYGGGEQGGALYGTASVNIPKAGQSGTGASQYGGMFGKGADAWGRQSFDTYTGQGGGGGGYYGGYVYDKQLVGQWNTIVSAGIVNSRFANSGGGSGFVGSELLEGETIAGNTVFLDQNGSEETGHTGDGYARVTYQPDYTPNDTP